MIIEQTSILAIGKLLILFTNECIFHLTRRPLSFFIILILFVIFLKLLEVPRGDHGAIYLEGWLANHHYQYCPNLAAKVILAIGLVLFVFITAVGEKNYVPDNENVQEKTGADCVPSCDHNNFAV